jgi:hypothetical protein
MSRPTSQAGMGIAMPRMLRVNTVSRWRCRVLVALLGCGALLPIGRVTACGYENPAIIALGSLNSTYPKSLWVSTAIWQARQEGLLPPAPIASGRLQAMGALYQLRRHLGNDQSMPDLAIVFIPAVMWSRLTPQPDKLALTMHVNGPENGDVVMVTEPAALQAWANKSLSTSQLLDNGLIRLYGDEDKVSAMQDALFKAHSDALPIDAQVISRP